MRCVVQRVRSARVEVSRWYNIVQGNNSTTEQPMNKQRSSQKHVYAEQAVVHLDMQHCVSEVLVP